MRFLTANWRLLFRRLIVDERERERKRKREREREREIEREREERAQVWIDLHIHTHSLTLTHTYSIVDIHEYIKSLPSCNIESAIHKCVLC